jgi:hypothetical protein
MRVGHVFVEAREMNPRAVNMLFGMNPTWNKFEGFGRCYTGLIRGRMTWFSEYSEGFFDLDHGKSCF